MHTRSTKPKSIGDLQSRLGSATLIKFRMIVTFQNTWKAPSDKSGGRKIKINSGSILIEGIAGIRLMIRPATTNRIGYAIFIV